MTEIRPAGMSYERALEIAIESDRRQRFDVPTPSEFSNGHRLSGENRQWILERSAEGWSAAVIAERLGISERSVVRIRTKARRAADEAAAWRAGQKRRQNLESFRRMDVEWSEIPA